MQEKNYLMARVVAVAMFTVSGLLFVSGIIKLADRTTPMAEIPAFRNVNLDVSLPPSLKSALLRARVRAACEEWIRSLLVLGVGIGVFYSVEAAKNSRVALQWGSGGALANTEQGAATFMHALQHPDGVEWAHEALAMVTDPRLAQTYVPYLASKMI